MRCFIISFLYLTLLSYCFCELSENKDELINAFARHLNTPKQSVVYGDGELLKFEDISNNEHYVEIKFTVTDPNHLVSPTNLCCSGVLTDHKSGSDNAPEITVKQVQCSEIVESPTLSKEEAEVNEGYTDIGDTVTTNGPVQLENEVTDAISDSGEQFVAVRRDTVPCIGCATAVDPTASGVEVLARLAVEHLDHHEPTTKHVLNQVVSVERQVQVVGGIRYIVILTVDYDDCTSEKTEECHFEKTCAIVFLEKPWLKVSDGTKYRAIISNNCTKEWLFDENDTFNNRSNFLINPTDSVGATDDDIKVIHQSEVHAQPVEEKSLTEQQLKELEQQIVPVNKVFQPLTTSHTINSESNYNVAAEKVYQTESAKPIDELTKTQQPNKNEHTHTDSLSDDKKKAIDELMMSFDFSPLKNNQLRKRSEDLYFVGGPLEKEVDDPQYKILAEESLQKYSQVSDDTQHYQVTNIDKVTVQVVSGVMTRIDFHITPTNCSIEANGLPTSSDCILQGNDKAIACHANILRKSLESKDIDVVCHSDRQSPQMKRRVPDDGFETQNRNKRQIPGAEVEDNPNKPEYVTLAQESLAQYVSSSGIREEHKVIEVVKVTTQVVAGTITRLDFKVQSPSGFLLCHSEVWEKSWENFKEINVTCDPVNSRKKRQIPGGEVEDNPNKPEYVTLAQESLAQYVSSSGIREEHKVIEVVKVTTQVVAGKITRLDFKVQSPSGFLLCHSEVWEKSWENFKEINVTCDPVNSRKKRQIPGGEVEDNRNKPEYVTLAQESLAQYVSSSGIREEHKVIEVVKVTTQVVAGKITRLDFKVQSPSGFLICHSEVWEKSWENFKEINVTCDPVNSRKKRQIPGGEVEDNPNKPEYVTLAQESLAQYVSSSGIREEHKVIEVVKVTTQVVAGTITRLDFKVQSPSGFLLCHSEVWEKSWENFKEINVTCDPVNSRKKRQVPGGSTEKNPDDPQYMALAQESLAQYVSSSGITEEHKVIKVVKVTTQVVAGTITRLDFKVQSPSGFLLCHSEVWKKSWENFKEINVTCDPVNYRKKRQVPGGSTEKNSDDPQYMALAQESLAQYVSSSGITEEHKVIKVVKVTIQVVAGTLTRLDFKVQSPSGFLLCHSEVWERPWLNSKQIVVTCDPVNYRKKRQVPGGSTEKNSDDPQYMALAQESLAQYVSSSGITEEHKVIKVVKVTIQVVAGTLTRLDFKVQSPSGFLLCHSEVWERPWLNSKQIVVTCDPVNYRKKRQVPGGSREKNSDDPQYMALAQESLAQYVSSSGITEEHKVIKVVKVTIQVVAGTLTRLDFKVQSPSGFLLCHSEVWERPWLNSKQIVVTCDPVNYRKKRQVPGGSTEKNSDDPQYMALAQESLAQYVSSSGITEEHKVIKVVKVSIQVVAGTLTRLDFKVQSPSGFLLCHSEVWERPWLNSKQIVVTCDPVNYRKKRQVPGGSTEKNSDDPQYMALAQESLAQYVSSSGITEEHKVIKVVKVTIQVVAGTLTRLDFKVQSPSGFLLCHSEVWERPWLNSKQIVVTCDPINSRKKREVHSFPPAMKTDRFNINNPSTKRRSGGPQDQDPTKPEFKVLASDALRKYQRLKKTEYSHKLIEVRRVVSQIVSGTKYNIDFTAAPTDCAANITNQDLCEVNKTTSLYCHTEIWNRPWLKRKQIEVQCHYEDANEDERVKRSSFGEPAENLKERKQEYSKHASVKPLTSRIFTEGNGIHALLQESLEKLENTSANIHKQRVLIINKYFTKVTAKKQTTIDFDVGYTNCLKFELVEDITRCNFLEDLPPRHCISLVTEKVFSDKGKDIQVYCDDDETLLHSLMEVETDESAMTLANESLKRIEFKYPHPRKAAVVRIIYLEKHLVGAVHYRMNLEVGYTNCMALSAEESCHLDTNVGNHKFCRVNVWYRPWVSHPPSYRVSCENENGVNHEMYFNIQAQQLFSHFLATYKPSYTNDRAELGKRYNIFKENVKKVHELNVHEMGTAKYGLTQFADLSLEEFRHKYLGLDLNLRNQNQVPMTEADIPNVQLPDSFDWRDHDAVTEVKNQGICGSCWAFSVTGNIEGQWKRHSGKLVSLSEQELVDCDKLDNGCDGGLPDNAYRAIEQLGGLETETDYPYEGHDEKCAYNASLSRVTISGAVNISSNETDMAKWLVANGPISIGINANAMQFYMGGVSHPWRTLCNPNNLDHGVLIVGYGTKDYPLFKKKLPYWIVKNSWGTSWGEDGYYRVFRGDGTCGLNLMASSAVV